MDGAVKTADAARRGIRRSTGRCSGRGRCPRPTGCGWRRRGRTARTPAPAPPGARPGPCSVGRQRLPVGDQVRPATGREGRPGHLVKPADGVGPQVGRHQESSELDSAECEHPVMRLGRLASAAAFRQAYPTDTSGNYSTVCWFLQHQRHFVHFGVDSAKFAVLPSPRLNLDVEQFNIARTAARTTAPKRVRQVIYVQLLSDIRVRAMDVAAVLRLNGMKKVSTSRPRLNEGATRLGGTGVR